LTLDSFRVRSNNIGNDTDKDRLPVLHNYARCEVKRRQTSWDKFRGATMGVLHATPPQ
jgi:hypothetical protein